MPTLKNRSKWFDASRDRKISVIAYDLKDAICKDHQNCVIAKAIKREMKAEWVDVGANTVLIKPWGSSRYTRYRLDSKAKEQVKWFDYEGNFAPCYVVLSCPSPSVRIGASAKYRLDKRARKGGPRGERNRMAKPSR